MLRDWFYQLNWMKATDSVGFDSDLKFKVFFAKCQEFSTWWIIVMVIMLDQLSWIKSWISNCKYAGLDRLLDIQAFRACWDQQFS